MSDDMCVEGGEFFPIVKDYSMAFEHFDFGIYTRILVPQQRIPETLSNLSNSKATSNFSTEAVRLVEQFQLDSKPNKIEDGKITFVTGSSERHFDAMTIGLFVKVYPNETLRVYSLVSTPFAQHNMMEQYSFVRLIPFPFAKYHQFDGNNFEYRWKPLVIAGLLKENFRVLWLDTSIHLYKPVPLDLFDEIRLFVVTKHSLYATTNPLMFDYFPTVDNQQLKKTQMFGGGFGAFLPEPKVKISLLRLWILCAWEQDCMGQMGSTIYCKFPSDRFNFYANFHRHDQSAINLILAHHYNFDTCIYESEFFYLLSVSISFSLAKVMSTSEADMWLATVIICITAAVIVYLIVSECLSGGRHTAALPNGAAVPLQQQPVGAILRPPDFAQQILSQLEQQRLNDGLYPVGSYVQGTPLDFINEFIQAERLLDLTVSPRDLIGKIWVNLSDAQQSVFEPKRLRQAVPTPSQRVLQLWAQYGY